MKIADLHNDLLTGCDDKLSQLSLYKNSPIEVVTAYFRGGNTLAKAVCDINKYLSVKPKNCHLAFEDIGYTDLHRIDCLLKFIPIYVSFTWNGENSLGYGCDFQEEDLKNEGISLIKKVNDYNVAIDCAHVSRKGFYTLADRANTFLCSHTAFDGVYKHKRNITDEQIKIIIEKGGVVGLCLYSDFLSNKKRATINDIVLHIDYFVNKFGYDNLCIGTDFFGAKNFVSNINNYQKMIKIVEKLKKIGYNIKAVESIFFENAIKFLKKVHDNQRFVK